MRTVSEVHNPISGMAVTLGKSLGLGLLVCIATLFLPAAELQLVYLGFAFFFVGVFAGRASIVGFLGFVGALLGTALAAILWFTVLPSFLPLPGFASPFPLPGWELPLVFLLGAVGGLGGMVTGKLGLRRVEQIAATVPKSRTCERCGSRVGLAARKCWSCRASLRI